MKQSFRWKQLIAGCCVLAFISINLTGCARLPRAGQQEYSQDPGTTQQYYVFTDVLIPREMKEDRKNTFMYHTAGMGLGMINLRGRADVTSLIDFFEMNMPKDNWQYVSSFKSAKSLLIYQKEKRLCAIIITEQRMFTYAEIWVAPVGTELKMGF